MILFHPEHVQPILTGMKIKTRRLGERRWNVNSVHKAKIAMISRDYFALLRILTIHREPLGAMTEQYAWDEGGYTLSGYKEEWEKINHSPWDPELVVWVVQFERVFGRSEICKHCWQFVGCIAKKCCVDKLFDDGDGYAGTGKIINFCCILHCRHDLEYHGKLCPVKLSGAGKEYVRREENRVVEKDRSGRIIRRLTDYV